MYVNGSMDIEGARDFRGSLHWLGGNDDRIDPCM